MIKLKRGGEHYLIDTRGLQVTDLEAFRNIRNEASRFLHDERVFSEKEVYNWWYNLSDTGTQYYPVVSYHDGVIGYFRVHHYETEIEIGLDLAKDHRNKKLGQFLYRRMISWLILNHRKPIISLYVRDDNPRAIHLYEKLGFEKFFPERGAVTKHGHPSWKMNLITKKWLENESNLYVFEDMRWNSQ